MNLTIIGDVVNDKKRVQTLLRARGPSSRKQLWRAIELPSMATYNRIMGELRSDGVVTAEGNRGKTVCSLAGKRAKAAGEPANKSRAKTAQKAGAAKAKKTWPPLLCPYP
jgi:hypothetical protein